MRFRFGLHRFHTEDGHDEDGPGGERHRGFRGPHRHGGGGPRGPGMRGRARMFEQGDLRLVILKLLADKPAHGYEIIKLVEERFGGGYAPSPGIVYPTLTLLEELGQVAVVQTEGARKLYDITPEGRAVLEAERTVVDRIFERIEEVRRRQGGTSDPRIVRATENLRTALRLRLEGGPLTPEQAATIAGILDEAAKAVERS
jgi:DNA-binding PadR family transcriptional regulator